MKVLVSGYIGFNNFGDEAIFYCLNNHLKTFGADVGVICNNCDETGKKYNVKTCYYKNFTQIIKAILNCDVLISGGGSLLQNKTSNFSLYYYLFIIFLAKLFFKKVIIFAQGIEPIKGKFNKLITKNILKIADYVTVRDNNSLNLLKENNINANLVSDPVYSLIQDTKINTEKSGLIIQLRKYNGMDEAFLNCLAEGVAKNYNKEKISVLSLQDEYDKEICINFKNKLGKYDIEAEIVLYNDILECINKINNAKYMISTRLHGIIAANGLNTKTFAIIYDDKVKTISDELDIENIDIKKYSKSELLSKLEVFFNSENKSKKFREFSWNDFDKKLEEFKRIK